MEKWEEPFSQINAVIGMLREVGPFCEDPATTAKSGLARQKAEMLQQMMMAEGFYADLSGLPGLALPPCEVLAVGERQSFVLRMVARLFH